MCSLYGIKPHWNLLVGFPGEGEEVYQRYLDVLPLLTHLEPPTGVYPVRFDRFSPYHIQAQSYGLDHYFADRNLMAEYFTSVAQWLGKLQAVVNQWLARWKDEQESLPPRLYFKGDSDIVYDTRSGSAVEYQVGRPGRAILNHLSKPTWIEDIVKTFSAEYGPDISREIEFLQEKGLVFQEGERLISLVLKECRKGNNGLLFSSENAEGKRSVHAQPSHFTRS
jgi:hypothetical protein